MLTYPMEERGTLPLYEYLYRRIRDDILSGVLRAEEKLPSRRALAEHLRVSVMTVEGAYRQLEAEGYLYARAKRGFFVSKLDAPPVPRNAPAAPLQPVSGPERRWKLDLRSNRVDAARFPLSTWARLVRQILSEGGDALLSPPPHQGLLELRRAICNDLSAFRGLSVAPE